MDELQLDVIAGCAKSQGQLDVSGVLLGLNADDAHAAGQKVFQIHEHFRPVEAAHRNNAIDESRAVMYVGNAFLLEIPLRSEEHTSELQSQSNLVCRLLLEKKKNTTLT